MKSEKVIPSHIQIETVSGICTLKCIMCPIKQRERKEIMTNEIFTKILKKFYSYLDNQKFLSLCGLGETLIDKKTNEKIKIAKNLGFRGIGVYTNGTLLNKENSRKLLESKLDSLIISIDGVTHKTQEAIRVGSKLDEIVSNVENFIILREKLNQSRTRLIIRFTRQELNKHEEKDFYNFWESRIKSNYDDRIVFYNVHNVGGNIVNFNEKLDGVLLQLISNLKCPEINERLMIFSDGSIALCCGDQFGHYKIGNVLDDDPVDLYNSKYFNHYRDMIKKGKILSLELCKNCSILYSIATRELKH